MDMIQLQTYGRKIVLNTSSILAAICGAIKRITLQHFRNSKPKHLRVHTNPSLLQQTRDPLFRQKCGLKFLTKWVIWSWKCRLQILISPSLWNAPVRWYQRVETSINLSYKDALIRTKHVSLFLVRGIRIFCCATVRNCSWSYFENHGVRQRKFNIVFLLGWFL